ncbi:MAG: F0F1 ATP synthase subunit alpha, partial [Pseudomonadota bacterium]|nr:F0F1 ATP synthase subunit alpha [Pseudomonadota bacterium]
TELLKQGQFSPLQAEEQVVVIYAGVNGYLDELPVADVGRFEQELLTHVHAKESNLLSTIRTEKALSDDTESKLKSVIEGFAAKFAA